MNYYIDNIDIKSTYGVFISASSGLISNPKPKRPAARSWAEYNGEIPDLASTVYEARDIKLECFIKADNREQFLAKVYGFLDLFEKGRTVRLMVDVGASKPLVYEVFLNAQVDIEKAFDPGQLVGTFTLNLREPEPVKRVLKFEATAETLQASITMTSPKLVSIYWGDTTVTEDVSGTDKVTTHTYSAAGVYYIVITGNINQVTALTSNATLIWSKI